MYVHYWGVDIPKDEFTLDWFAMPVAIECSCNWLLLYQFSMQCDKHAMEVMGSTLWYPGDGIWPLGQGIIKCLCLRVLVSNDIPLQLACHSCKFFTVPNRIYIKNFSTATVVLRPICKPTQQGTNLPLQEALCYACITQHITHSSLI